MVWHNDEGMQDIVSQNVGVVVDGFHDHVCDAGLAQEERPAARFVEQSIHGDKCLSGVERFLREGAMNRQAVVETPREKDGPISLIYVRESPLVERHARVVPQTPWNSHQRPADQGVGCGPGGPPHL
jgi:hypothetical protein